jgi:hypothetical protein
MILWRNQERGPAITRSEKLMLLTLVEQLRDFAMLQKAQLEQLILIFQPDSLLVENALLRQQLIIVKRQRKRPQFSWRERVLLIFLAGRLPHWRQALSIVQSETLLR